MNELKKLRKLWKKYDFKQYVGYGLFPVCKGDGVLKIMKQTLICIEEIEAVCGECKHDETQQCGKCIHYDKFEQRNKEAEK